MFSTIGIQVSNHVCMLSNHTLATTRGHQLFCFPGIVSCSVQRHLLSRICCCRLVFSYRVDSRLCVSLHSLIFRTYLKSAVSDPQCIVCTIQDPALALKNSNRTWASFVYQECCSSSH